MTDADFAARMRREVGDQQRREALARQAAAERELVKEREAEELRQRDAAFGRLETKLAEEVRAIAGSAAAELVRDWSVVPHYFEHETLEHGRTQSDYLYEMRRWRDSRRKVFGRTYYGFPRPAEPAFPPLFYEYFWPLNQESQTVTEQRWIDSPGTAHFSGTTSMERYQTTEVSGVALTIEGGLRSYKSYARSSAGGLQAELSPGEISRLGGLSANAADVEVARIWWEALLLAVVRQEPLSGVKRGTPGSS